MPTLSKKLCATHGIYSGRQCPKCAEIYDDQRGSAKSRGYDSRWRRIRQLKLRDNPLCERCHWPAYLVHHIDRDSRNNDDVNLESLCQACHNREHGKDKRK